MGLGSSNTYVINISASQMWMLLSFLGIFQKCIYFIQYIWDSAFLLFLEFFFLLEYSSFTMLCYFLSSVQSLSCVWLFATPWTATFQACLSITSSQSLLKLISIVSVMPSNHLILGRPLVFLPSIFPIIRVFSNESALCIRWPKYWSSSFNISPSNKHSGLISFRMDWLDLLAVQETLKSLLQCHSSKASILWCSAFFMVQLSHPYTTTGKTIAWLDGPLLTK